MKFYFERIRPEALLATGGIIIFCTFGLLFFRSHLQPLHTATDFEKGQYYFNSGDKPSGAYDLAKAQYFYERALQENPQGNTLAWYQSGRIDFINGNFDSALVKFAKQIEYFGDDVPNVYYMLGLTYGYKARATHDPQDWQNAEENFKKAISFFYKAPWPYVDLAWIYFSEGKYEAMKPILEQGIAYQANNPWLLNMYGLALLNTGDRAMAREYFLFARDLANKVTVEEWGRSYSGNNPATWGVGLAEFKTLIAKNIVLTETK